MKKYKVYYIVTKKTSARCLSVERSRSIAARDADDAIAKLRRLIPEARSPYCLQREKSWN